MSTDDFAVYASDDRSLSQLLRRLIEAAWTHHWSAVAKVPVIEAREDGGLGVTALALDALCTQDIEAAIREAIRSPTKPLPASLGVERLRDALRER